MENCDRLKMITVRVVPQHMGSFAEIARAQGLNASSLIRLLIAQTVRRKAVKRKA
jgi:antitoxin component of RelBE/YafQ-DinJ toxin-antitoxin module